MGEGGRIVGEDITVFSCHPVSYAYVQLITYIRVAVPPQKFAWSCASRII